MKIKFIVLAAAMLGMLFSSCIKDEGKFREADVLNVSWDDNEGFLSPIIKEDTREIYLIVKDTTGLSEAEISPKLTLSPGATVTPGLGEMLKLEDYKAFYTVTAEDGGEKTYLLKVDPFTPLTQDFERWYTVSNKTGTKVYEMPSDPSWTNANEGVNMLYPPNTLFPTRSSTDSYTNNLSVVLETVEGNFNPVVDMMNIPIYAGNMYRGKFRALDALKNPLLTTLFGQVQPEYAGKPVKLTAWYKYIPGAIYQSWQYDPESSRKKKKIIYHEDKTDEPDIYAILYKIPKEQAVNSVYLTAVDIKTSDKIVATAFMKDRSRKENWTRLEIPFQYSEALDYKAYNYKLAVVLASSIEGASYFGAIGSILTIDDLEIECVGSKL